MTPCGWNFTGREEFVEQENRGRETHRKATALVQARNDGGLD